METGQIDELYARCLARDRVALGRAVTLLESTRPEDREAAVVLLDRLDSHLRSTRGGLKLTVSGSPGVGKSSLIEVLGQQALESGLRVGVVTVDPTSALSKGSILGDKARMTTLSNHPEAFVRSSPAGDVLGGLGRRTFETLTLLEAAGFDLVLLETVGVGQSEHLAWSFTDGFILVLQPGAGDELQGIKRGITELADIVLVNKADTDLKLLAEMARAQYAQALHYLTPPREGWEQKVLACSAQTGYGLPEVLKAMLEYREYIRKATDPESRRAAQRQAWLTWSVEQTAQDLILEYPAIRNKLSQARRNDSRASSIFKTEYEIGQILSDLFAGVSSKSSNT